MRVEERSSPSLFERAVQDIGHAARSVWRNPGFAACAAVILAVGITASTGLFAVLDAMVLRPLSLRGGRTPRTRATADNVRFGTGGDRHGRGIPGAQSSSVRWPFSSRRQRPCSSPSSPGYGRLSWCRVCGAMRCVMRLPSGVTPGRLVLVVSVSWQFRSAWPLCCWLELVRRFGPFSSCTVRLLAMTRPT